MPGGAFAKPSGLALRAITAGRANPVISFGIGKGLKEPCDPYREWYVFGAELNSIDIPSVNCLLSVWDPTTTFDLSSIKPSHEVVVVLLNAANLDPGSYLGDFKWYRNRDDKLLYHGKYPVNLGGYASISFYSYIGYVSWELWENGEHRVEATLSGAVYREFIQTFIVKGIPIEEPAPPAPATPFMELIVAKLVMVACYFMDLSEEALKWIPPFNRIAAPLTWIADLFTDMAALFNTFGEWVDEVAEKFTDMLSWEAIWELILRQVPDLPDIIDWFLNWWELVSTRVTDWWELEDNPIRLFINSATAALPALVKGWNTFWDTLWPGLLNSFSALQTNWNTFWTITYPTLVDVKWAWDWWKGRLTEVTELVDSKLKVALPFRDTLVELWKDIASFFTDPLEYLWARFTDWFLGREV